MAVYPGYIKIQKFNQNHTIFILYEKNGYIESINRFRKKSYLPNFIDLQNKNELVSFIFKAYFRRHSNLHLKNLCSYS